MVKISFLGFGMFNCAIAHYLSNKFLDDNTKEFGFYDIDSNVLKYFEENKKHPYHFNNFTFNNLNGYNDSKDLISDSDYIILGISVQAISTVLSQIKNYINKDVTFVIVSKGIDISSHKLIGQIIDSN
jgi:glycerol-3-phosphate dehydrogenase